MSEPEYSFVRYLAAKKSVDDRALNRHVMDAFQRILGEIDTEIVEILEIGAGIGTMAERLIECEMMPPNARYTTVDAVESNIAEARRRLAPLMDQVIFDLRATDVFDLLADQSSDQQWDVLIAHAFLDLIDLQNELPRLLSLLKPGGVFWFTVNFDGVTAFEPILDPAFDAAIVDLYHTSMEARISGAPETGRRLLTRLLALRAEIRAAGSSDWVVVPGRNGYRDDEAYFLHFIIHTVDAELHDHPELDGQRFREWVAARHRQIDHGELVYIAHQLDMVGILKDTSL